MEVSIVEERTTMSSNNLPESPLSPRTDKIVGRKKEMATIKRAIRDTGSRRILYFVAGGGMGKTRLLEEVGQIQKPILCPPIIDLYHQQNHSPGGLRQAIIEGLGTSSFPRYEKQRALFEQKREIGQGGKSLEDLRTELDTIFVEEYNQVAARKRIVLRVDTMELLQYEDDSVQKTCLVDDVNTVIKNWLLRIIPKLKNTVVIFAGRPQPKTEAEFSTLAGMELYPLPPFTRDESEEYLHLMRQKYPKQLDQILLSQNPPDIHAISDGKPIRLALVVDLLRYEQPFNPDLPRGEVDEELVARLMHLDSLGLPIQFLLKARKGLDKPLLQYLWGTSNTPDFDALMVELSELTVVKTYQGDKVRLFLHDELYDLFDRYFHNDSRYGPEYFQTLRDYYQEKLDEETKRVAATSDPEALKEQISEIERIKLALLYYGLQCEPSSAYTRYYLLWDEEAIKKHETGFDMQLRDEVLRFYNRYAFRKDSPFYDKRIADLVVADRIHRDCAVRWVKRHIARGDFEKAIKAADNVYESKKDIFRWEIVDDPAYKAGLLTAWSEASLYTGAPEREIQEKLDEAIGLLLNGDIANAEVAEMDTTPPVEVETWWKKQILGKAYNNRGYLYWSTGRYGFAFDDFRHALGYFRQAGLEDERANTLTNLAYLMALMGRVATAQYHIQQAIEIRERLDKNRRYTIALSRNTRGLIHILGDEFDIGIQECREALAICEEVNERRGIGLACIALGFGLRRQGEQWKRGRLIYPIESAAGNFSEAESFLGRAVAIFAQAILEPIRHWQAYNELGSLFCDWAYLARNIGDPKSQLIEGQYQKAIEYHQTALSIAEKHDLAFQITDSHDDLAQTYHDYAVFLGKENNFDEAKTYYSKAENCLARIEAELIPKAYQFASSSQHHDTNVLPESGLAYWQSMGKLYLQRGVWESQKLRNREITFAQRSEALQRCIRYFTISFAYFQRYGPHSAHVHNTLKAFTERLSPLEISAQQAHQQIEKVEAEYNLNLRILKERIDDTLGI
jgi:tetratricopeptide (TPR) repeat protein